MNSPEFATPGVWKTVALVCVSIMVAGAPAIVYAIRTWTVADQVGLIRDRQDDVRQRLSILETQNADLIDETQRLRAELQAHRDAAVEIRGQP